MMAYKVTASIIFHEPDEATDFYHDCQLAIAKGVSINVDQPNEERSAIYLEQCFHDTDETIPCKVIESMIL